MSIFTDVWAWLKKEFKHITQDIAKVAIAATEKIKTVVESKEVGFIANILDELKFHGLANEALATIKNSIVKVLTFELALQIPSGDITSEEFIAWEENVLKALGVHPDQTAIWTKVSASIIRDFEKFYNDKNLTFYEGVQMAQDAWLTYKEAKAIAEE